MVATRRGTRVEAQEEGSGGEQTSVEPATPASSKRTQRTSESDSLIQGSGTNSQNPGESTVVTGSPSKNDSRKGLSQVVTRNRHRSGQSDADVSEAESSTSNSSTRVTRSRQSLGSVTDSGRKLRNHRSAVITEPILESKEDELSEAESNCSSVSTRASRRIQASASCSSRMRSRKPATLPEAVSDHSDVESICSSVSGLQYTANESTRRSRATGPTSVSDSQKEVVSEAESFHSDFACSPRVRRSSRRILSKPLSDVMSVAETSGKDLESPKKQRDGLRAIKVSQTLSPVREQNLLCTPRRSLRNRIESTCSDVLVLSDSDSQSKESSSKKEAAIDPPRDEESLKEQANMALEPSLGLDGKSPEPSQSTSNDAPEKIIDLTEDSVDNYQLKEQEANLSNVSVVDSEKAENTNMDDSKLNTDNQSAHSSTSLQHVDKSVNISLVLDSESEESESSEEEADIEMEEEENQEDLVKSKSLKKSSTEQYQDLADNGLFVIDTVPGVDSSKKYYVDHHVDDKLSENEQSDNESLPEQEHSEPDEEEEDFIDEEVNDDEEEELLNRPKVGFELSTRIDTGLKMKELGGLYISFDAEKPNPGTSLQKSLLKGSKKKDELLKKSVITPDFEKKESVTHKQLKKQRKEDRDKTTGRGWFDMKAPELTEELKNDLKALKMRSAMDPKRFYKKLDRDGFPKYFQVGTVVDNPIDYYHSRIPKKERKRTIVEELLADSEFRSYNKKKFQEIIAEKAARAEGKKNRKKKKFRS